MMEVECQGCYYTLCSFVCLTENLSEILQFLWRHGCLRRTYFCEKCGRKCAIGDKDLFFRCNRNTLDIPVVPQKVKNLSLQSNTQHIINVQNTPSQVKCDENRQIIVDQIEQFSQQEFMILNRNIPEENQQNKVQSLSGANSDNLLLLNCSNRLENSELLDGGVINNNSVNLTVAHNPLLNNSQLNQSEGILTVIDSERSQIICTREENSGLITSENSNAPLISSIQYECNVSSQLSNSNLSLNESAIVKLPTKTKKKSNKSGWEDGKIPKKRCNFKVSMKKGTFFEKSKLPIDTVCKFVVFWCCLKNPTQEFLRNELSLATRTVVDWSTSCREICIHWAKSVSEKIGGDGVMVQVDEVKIQNNKESKQNDNRNRFSFWGMEKDKEKGKIFIVPVAACNSWSLLAVINDWILPGSVIISNCWKTYDCLKLQEFVQQTVIQSKTFVHPQNSAGQQSIDGKLDEVGSGVTGELLMPKFGTRRSHHLGDLAEFMFKRRYSNHLERMHAFFKQVSSAYPLL